MKNNQQNHIGMFLYLIQVKAVLFTIISIFLGSTPFDIACGSYSQQLKYMKIQCTGVRRIDLAMTKRRTGDIFPLVDC